MTMIAPLTEIEIPKIFNRVSFYLKKRAESNPMKMGLVAIIMAARPAVM